jgi:HK97 family phage major capsid protein
VTAAPAPSAPTSGPTAPRSTASSLGVTGELLGSPVVTDWNFGTNGSAVKPVAFGDWSAYYIRDVGNFRFERSDERYFDTDEVGFRGSSRPTPT